MPFGLIVYCIPVIFIMNPEFNVFIGFDELFYIPGAR
jgi:hypothetical protein